MALRLNEQNKTQGTRVKNVELHIFFRKIKTSFKKQKVCSFPSYEQLSQHWHSNILVDPKPTFESGTDIINGMYFDPAEFLPKYMARWLEKKVLERSPIPPGYYHVKFKVYYILV